MKKLLSIFLLCIFTTSVFAYNGIVSGEKNLKVAKTKWFDIIYPEASAKTASILFEKADALYEDITADLGIKPDFRMPVVITPGTEQFNAYFTTSPYNHIVIYDTGVITQLEVFTETVLYTFKHELTHAVTFNMKIPAFKAINAFFGDSFPPFEIFLVSSGMAEGATLCSEAKEGEGRLNNTISMMPVIQAKIENQIPGYFDESGVGTSYPAGSFYEFNGAFHHWLQEKYGMEKYADFWYKAVNLGGLTIEGVFKKVYGIKLKEAWKTCFNEYKVPDIPANPVENHLVKDFFDSSKNNYSLQNSQGILYSSLQLTDSGLYYLDSASSNIYFVPLNDKMMNQQKNVKQKKS